MEPLSISKQLRGRTVLLTGSLGFVGSTCLEQLLRLTEVKSVLLLVRGKGKQTAQQRVEKMLSGPLFHLLHKQAQHDPTSASVFSRVRIIEGDLEAPGLGLSEGDRQLLQDETEVVLHSAANLGLDAHIQRTLRSNYCGTRELLDLAAQMPCLRSFVFVSTYYVNSFKPYNSSVPEEVHYPPLQLTGDPNMLSHEQLVAVLMSLAPDTAAAEASSLMSRLNMPSTYAFGKLLTEQLVDAPTALPAHVAKAVVRPSLVHSMAGAPLPGYCSSRDGSPGYMLAYATGFTHDIKGVAFASDAFADFIPVDTVSALIIAAAAAAAASGSSVSSPFTSSNNRATVYHAASTARHPQSITDVYARAKTFWEANPSPFRLPFARLPTFEGRHIPNDKDRQRSHRVTGIKVWTQTTLLQLAGRKRQVAALRNGFKAFRLLSTPGYARSFICLVDNACRLRASLRPDEAAAWPCLVWDKDTSLDWETYLYTSMVGLHTSAFKVPLASITTPVPHLYEEHKGLADTSIMREWMATASAAATVTTAAPAAAAAAATAAAEAAADAAAASSSSSSAASEGSVDGDLDRWYLDAGIEVVLDTDQHKIQDAVSTAAHCVANQVASN